jgi:hypothetical protein
MPLCSDDFTLLCVLMFSARENLRRCGARTSSRRPETCVELVRRGTSETLLLLLALELLARVGSVERPVLWRKWCVRRRGGRVRRPAPGGYCADTATDSLSVLKKDDSTSAACQTCRRVTEASAAPFPASRPGPRTRAAATSALGDRS